jgi:galactokinase
VRDVLAIAPGRVNLIGEHTDYNHGLALPFAIAQHVRVAARGLARPRIEVEALDLGETDSFPLEGFGSAGGWRDFVRGAVAELQCAGCELRGARLQISGTVPRGGGLASSAALAVALVLALRELSSIPPPEPEDRLVLARLCSRIENEWLGARTGLLDQLACLGGQEGHALRIDFRSLEMEPIRLDLGEWRLVTLDSGERHLNAASGYNERREECARACRLLGVATLREARPGDVAGLPAPLAQRARHVLESNERVRAAVQALKVGDLPELGRLLDAGHASLRDLYEVSTPAVEATVAGLKAGGAAGARLIGGGFGGHVLGLMPPGVSPPDGAVEVGPGPGARVQGAPGTMLL